MLAEEQSDFYVKPLLEIALELLKEIEFEPGMVITIGRSVLCQWERFIVLLVFIDVQWNPDFLKLQEKWKLPQETGSSGVIPGVK